MASRQQKIERDSNNGSDKIVRNGLIWALQNQFEIYMVDIIQTRFNKKLFYEVWEVLVIPPMIIS